MTPLDPITHRAELRRRCRLLLQRHLRRYWYRAVGADGHLGHLEVSLDETRAVLLGESVDPPLKLAPLASLDAAIAENRASVAARQALAEQQAGHALPIEVLATLGLDPQSIELLLITATLQADPALLRVARPLFGEPGQPSPTAGFIIELCADDEAHRRHLERALLPDWPLRRLRLITLGDDRRRRTAPPLTRAMLAAASVERLIAGDPPFDDFAPTGAMAIEVDGPPPDALVLADPTRIARLLDDLAHRRDPIPVVLIGAPGSGRRTVARAHALAAGRVLIRLDPSALPLDADGFDEALGALLRDARLADGVVLVRCDDLADRDDRRLGVLARLVAAMRPSVILTATAESAPAVTAALPTARVAAIEAGDVATRKKLYARLLVQHAFDLSRHQLSRLVDTYRMNPGDLDRALTDVRAIDGGESLERQAFDRAVRRQVRSRLGDLATSITTAQTWEDLVVDADQRATIDEIISHARHRTEVFEDWGFSDKVGGRGRGLACLFSGPPGTGKTMTASLIAKALDLECYLVDLSRVVDKYIGETEKNLGRLFDEASRAPVVLLFDEADSLFAARTQVESSNDRYANLEVNFLLQRMERFEGISILTTNRETAIDPAFKRRLRFRLHFDLPGEIDRERLWRAMVPAGVPIAPDIDYAGLARQWEMSGALIRNAMLRAAFLAAARRRPIDEALIREAARSELVEMGRLGN